ncbi:hypothetical protein ABTL78_20015, partial [Acinetobacter baumannii]
LLELVGGDACRSFHGSSLLIRAGVSQRAFPETSRTAINGRAIKPDRLGKVKPSLGSGRFINRISSAQAGSVLRLVDLEG